MTPESRDGGELTATELYAILRLRVDVFVVEQKAAYPEIDGRDLLPETRHLWVGGEQVESYLRVLADPGGVRRIGRVCTAEDARGRGLAAELMKAALAGGDDVDWVLDAQTYVQGFYAKFGFVPEGEEFTDEDDIPHITMWRRVARTP
ncbi:GNAT family N-acetyltransferase [Amycolatopsis sp. H20-H5]|uniref:GNAT family N-acetyltransferase n=1 Tax=Amycolatopsis sp. H20-H5 TaxID=3046309 RepID=UPI002DB993BA|nr:GNAT family N-acetyltransferase [Amycolatopsis sp. H20-H5]MEC3981182.1 GNAT family N-acetyltransferase [Amycolatopsis sp. H20-H5]